MATYIHGIASSQNIDSSGEIVNIEGLDISSLAVDGVFNYEHEQGKITDKDGKLVELQIKVPSQVVGKILKAHKIFSPEDCQDEHQLYFWNKIKTPYVYIMGELLDEYTDAAKDLAGKFRYDLDNKHKNERAINNFSIEGGKLERKGIEVTRSVARRVTITTAACNKTAIAEMFPTKKITDINSLFKTEPTEIEVLKVVPVRESSAEELKKALDLCSSNVAPGQLVCGAALSKENLLKSKNPSSSSSDQDVSDMLPDASSTKTGPSNPSVKPAASTPPKTTAKPTPKISIKPPTEGSRVNTKFGRMTYQYTSPPKSSIKKTTPTISVKPPTEGTRGDDKFGRVTYRYKGTPRIDHNKPYKPINNKEKSKKLLMAEEEYSKWPKKEEFRKFMKNRMPHLTSGEVDAIGKTLSLKKSMDMEKALMKMAQEDILAPMEKAAGQDAIYTLLLFDPNELKMGIEIEMEHTDDPKVAEKIAKEHLAEHPKYYSTLKQCFGEE